MGLTVGAALCRNGIAGYLRFVVGDYSFVLSPDLIHLCRVTKLGEIQEAILRLEPQEQQQLRHWLDETARETPEMLAAIDEGLHSLATEGGVPLEEARRQLRQWTTKC